MKVVEHERIEKPLENASWYDSKNETIHILKPQVMYEYIRGCQEAHYVRRNTWTSRTGSFFQQFSTVWFFAVLIGLAILTFLNLFSSFSGAFGLIFVLVLFVFPQVTIEYEDWKTRQISKRQINEQTKET